MNVKRIYAFLAPTVIWAGVTIAAMPVAAQEQAAAKTAEVNGVEVGERVDERRKADEHTPNARLNNRIRNRIDNRVRNRVDRTYTEQQDTTSSYERAERRVRQARQPR